MWCVQGGGQHHDVPLAIQPVELDRVRDRYSAHRCCVRLDQSAIECIVGKHCFCFAELNFLQFPRY